MLPLNLVKHHQQQIFFFAKIKRRGWVQDFWSKAILPNAICSTQCINRLVNQ
jgi:hypothetical protein